MSRDDLEAIDNNQDDSKNLWQQYQIYLSLSDIFSAYEPMTFEEYTSLPQRDRV